MHASTQADGTTGAGSLKAASVVVGYACDARGGIIGRAMVEQGP